MSEQPEQQEKIISKQTGQKWILKSKAKKTSLRNTQIPKMNRVIKANIERYITEYNTGFNSLTYTASPLYNVLIGKLPAGEKKDLVIIDPYMQKDLTLGTQTISVKRIKANEIKKYKDASWANENMNIMRFDLTTEPNKFLKNCSNWQKTLNLLFYQGLEKDTTIVNIMKSIMVPIPENSLFQRYNNHTFLFTQTSTGKTQLAKEMGFDPMRNPTWPGLAGSSEVYGFLHGHGALFLDECSLVKADDETPLIGQLLDYMVQGSVTRGVHKGVTTEGSKTIVFLGNPPLNNPLLMGYNLNFLFKKMGGLASADRFGARVGIFAIGTDFKAVKGTPIFKPDIYFAIRTLIKECFLVNNRKYNMLFKMYLKWFDKDDDEYADVRKDININSVSLSDFADGLIKVKGHLRTKCAAFKYNVLQNLDLFIRCNAKEFYKNTHDHVFKAYEYYKNINIKSLRMLSSLPEKPTKSFFFDLCEKDPKVLNMPLRLLESMFNVDYTTISYWKKDFEMLQHVKKAGQV